MGISHSKKTTHIPIKNWASCVLVWVDALILNARIVKKVNKPELMFDILGVSNAENGARTCSRKRNLALKGWCHTPGHMSGKV